MGPNIPAAARAQPPAAREKAGKTQKESAGVCPYPASLPRENQV